MENKYQVALDNLIRSFGNSTTDIEWRKWCISKLQELVNKETPKKIIDKYCPKCFNIKFDIGDRYNYCYECGQKLDWGEQDENS